MKLVNTNGLGRRAALAAALVVAGTTCLAITAQAQDPNGPPPPPQGGFQGGPGGQGGPPPGGGMGMGRGGMQGGEDIRALTDENSPLASYVKLTDEQKKRITTGMKALRVLREAGIPPTETSKLKLTDEQIEKLAAAAPADTQRPTQGGGQNGGPNGGGRQQMQQRLTASRKAVRASLTETQLQQVEGYLNQEPMMGGGPGGQGGPGGRGQGGFPPGGGQGFNGGPGGPPPPPENE